MSLSGKPSGPLESSLAENSEAGSSGPAKPEREPFPAENPFYSLGFNIILPVLILNRGAGFFSSNGHLWALLLALAIPVLYGLRGYFLSGKINTLSLLGAFGVLLTGGLALLQLEGIYFAIKEGAVPLVLGMAVLGSVFFKKPLALLFFKSPFFRHGAVFQKLRERGAEKDFARLMRQSTVYFAGSFFLSAALNFFIGLWIFKDISSLLPEEERRQILNQQIADMTWMGYALIALPLTLITGLVFWHALRRLKALTGLKMEEILRPSAPP